MHSAANMKYIHIMIKTKDIDFGHLKLYQQNSIKPLV